MRNKITNEEKARELAIKSTRDIDDNGNEVYNALVEAALQEMATWKEQQMIEKAVSILRERGFGAIEAYCAAMEMAEWKDKQLKQFLKDRYNKNLGTIESCETKYIYEVLFNEPI